MAIRTVRRTYRASIRNHRQVSDSLDSLGFAGSKLWNVGRWTIARVWGECGKIPNKYDLQKYLKRHERYGDLHSHSSQRVLSELGEAFESWYEHRRQGDEKANPPGYRKHGDDHPRSTVTFKKAGFKHDAENGYLRLSKGQNLKESRSDFVLCAYETRPDVDLSNDSVSVQQVRAVWSGDEWELHINCKVEKEVPDAPGDHTAGIDLGICNIAAVSFGDESVLYPGGALKEDEYYFAKERAKCDDSASREARRLDRKRTERRTHFLHTLSEEIVSACKERGVGTIVVGDLGGIRSEENGDARDWGDHGNMDLHRWAFDRFTTMLTYKAEAEGIDVESVSERGTSRTCSACGTEDDSQRVHRGLYVCDDCGLVANADCNGAENIRIQGTPESITDRDNGCLAQPTVRRFDATEGRFLPQESADCEP